MRNGPATGEIWEYTSSYDGERVYFLVGDIEPASKSYSGTHERVQLILVCDATRNRRWREHFIMYDSTEVMRRNNTWRRYA